jgi:hypothetical protein
MDGTNRNQRQNPFSFRGFPVDMQDTIMTSAFAHSFIYCQKTRKFYSFHGKYERVFVPPFRLYWTSAYWHWPVTHRGDTVAVIERVWENKVSFLAEISARMVFELIRMHSFRETNQTVSVVSNDFDSTNTVFPHETDPGLLTGRLVASLSMGEKGAFLDLDKLNNVVNLITFKLDSRKCVVRQVDGEGSSIRHGRITPATRRRKQRDLFFACLDQGSTGNHFDNIARSQIRTTILEELILREGDASRVAGWIANQARLQTLKLQYLNVRPGIGWPLATLKTVRLRRCSARLFWYYVRDLSLDSLSVHEPTSFRVHAQPLGQPREEAQAGAILLDVIPVRSLAAVSTEGNDGLVCGGITQTDTLEHHRLEPIPVNFLGTQSLRFLRFLSLGGFSVEGHDLTNLLSPFTGLHSLTLQTTNIRVLPVIPSLTNLVLSDIFLATRWDSLEENVFHKICRMPKLESLTLDNVVTACVNWDVQPFVYSAGFRVQPNPPRYVHENFEDLQQNHPFFMHQQMDSERIRSTIQEVGTNHSIRKLTLGLHGVRNGEHRLFKENFLLYLSKMFPNVSELTILFRGVWESGGYFNPSSEGVDGDVMHQMERKPDRDDGKDVDEGWDLNTIKFVLNYVLESEETTGSLQSRTVTAGQNDPMNYRTVVTQLENADSYGLYSRAPIISGLQILIQMLVLYFPKTPNKLIGLRKASFCDDGGFNTDQLETTFKVSR